MDEFDVVRLMHDRPDMNLTTGMIGTIVHIFEHPERAYEIEFADDQGRTIIACALLEGELAVLNTDELDTLREG